MPDTIVEKIYYKLPIFVQNTCFSLYGWNLARKRYNRHFYKYLEQLKEMEWWSKEKIKEYQNSNIVNIIKYAYFNVPFYRKFYDKYGVSINNIKSINDLSTLPILNKKTVKKNNNYIKSDAFNKRHLIKTLTSGTTGTPLTIYQTYEGIAFQWALWWRHKARFGLKPKDRHLTFGARIPVNQKQSQPPYWRNDIFNNRVYLSTYHISKNTIKDIVDFLNNNYFDFFTGYPSAIYFTSCLMQEEGLELYNCPKYIVTGADALLSNYESTISKTLRAPVTEQYGMAEFAGNLSKCPVGNFHEDFECCYVETQKTNDPNYYKLWLLTIFSK